MIYEVKGWNVHVNGVNRGESTSDFVVLRNGVKVRDFFYVDTEKNYGKRFRRDKDAYLTTTDVNGETVVLEEEVFDTFDVFSKEEWEKIESEKQLDEVSTLFKD